MGIGEEDDGAEDEIEEGKGGCDMNIVRRKYFDHAGWRRIGKRRLWMASRERGGVREHLSMIHYESVRRPLLTTVFGREFCLLDAGYVFVQWLTEGSHWAATAILDANGQVCEWYFDIVLRSGVEHGLAYYDDLLLDVAVFPDGSHLLLDADELVDAVRAGNVTPEQEQMAHEVARGIIEGIDVTALSAKTRDTQAWLLANAREADLGHEDAWMEGNAFAAMEEKDYAQQVCAWRYEDEWAVYNIGVEGFDELREGKYFAYASPRDEVLGYICFADAARIPASEPFDWEDGSMDVGVGLRPDLCGQGRGAAFFADVVSFARGRFPGAALRLSVAEWNRRAICVYEKQGFARVAAITHAGTGVSFVVMRMADEG